MVNTQRWNILKCCHGICLEVRKSEIRKSNQNSRDKGFNLCLGPPKEK